MEERPAIKSCAGKHNRAKHPRDQLRGLAGKTTVGSRWRQLEGLNLDGAIIPSRARRCRIRPARDRQAPRVVGVRQRNTARGAILRTVWRESRVACRIFWSERVWKRGKTCQPKPTRQIQQFTDASGTAMRRRKNFRRTPCLARTPPYIVRFFSRPIWCHCRPRRKTLRPWNRSR
jgi:hypothetical protein